LSVFDAFDPMFDDPPGCWLSSGAQFFPSLGREDAVLGVDYDFFVLPPITEGGSTPVFGEANLLVALTDRPEVREFLRHAMDTEAVPAWAASAGDIFVPAHAGFDSANCAFENAEPETNALRVRLCDAAQATVANGEFRLDASDYMPPEIGLPGPPAERGEFIQGMIDFILQGPGSLDAILARIEAAWPD
jgi:alpha-glucoside transport system substrate-binding protein